MHFYGNFSKLCYPPIIEPLTIVYYDWSETLDTKKAKVGKYQCNVADVVRPGGHAASLEGQKKQKEEERREIRDIIIVYNGSANGTCSRERNSSGMHFPFRGGETSLPRINDCTNSYNSR